MECSVFARTQWVFSRADLHFSSSCSTRVHMADESTAEGNTGRGGVNWVWLVNGVHVPKRYQNKLNIMHSGVSLSRRRHEIWQGSRLALLYAENPPRIVIGTKSTGNYDIIAIRSSRVVQQNWDFSVIFLGSDSSQTLPTDSLRIELHMKPWIHCQWLKPFFLVSPVMYGQHFKENGDFRKWYVFMISSNVPWFFKIPQPTCMWMKVLLGKGPMLVSVESLLCCPNLYGI